MSDRRRPPTEVSRWVDRLPLALLEALLEPEKRYRREAVRGELRNGFTLSREEESASLDWIENRHRSLLLEFLANYRDQNTVLHQQALEIGSLVHDLQCTLKRHREEEQETA